MRKFVSLLDDRSVYRWNKCLEINDIFYLSSFNVIRNLSKCTKLNVNAKK